MFLSPILRFGMALALPLRVKLIVEESTMRNLFFETAWGKDPGVSVRKAKAGPPASLSFDDMTRLIGEAACDWHGICNNAGCPTFVDWRAI